LNWLDAFNPGSLFNAKVKLRTKGTCGWILKDSTYMDWKERSDRNCLWVEGIPGMSITRISQKTTDILGAGKSVLSAKLIEEFQDLTETTILYYYFWTGDAKTTSPLALAVSLVAQLIHNASDEPLHTILLNILKSTIHTGAAYSDRGRNLDSVRQTFTSMLHQYPQKVIIIIDALDECTEHMRSQLVTTHIFDNLVKCKGTKFLITGRPSVKGYFDDQPNVLKVDVNANNYNDIAQYIAREVEEHPGLKQHGELIIETVNIKASGMFFYAGTIKR
jgi:hypothetical protein